MKLEKISNNALYAVCGIAVLCFLLFFCVGYGNTDEAGRTAPLLTDLLLGLQYVLGVVTFCLMIWSVVKGVQNTAGNDEMATTGIPGSKIVMFTGAVTIVSLLIGALLGIGEEDFTTNSGTTTPGYMITMVDAFMWSMYILFFVAVVAVVVAATGVMTKTATKK